MEEGVSFTVYGRPRPGGSKTIVRGKSGATWIREAAKGVTEWRSRVAQEAGRAMNGGPLLEGALRMELTFELPRPASHLGSRGQVRNRAPKHPITRPDITKLVRAVEDALTGVVWRDDAQVVEQLARKRYGERYALSVRIGAVE